MFKKLPTNLVTSESLSNDITKAMLIFNETIDKLCQLETMALTKKKVIDEEIAEKQMEANKLEVESNRAAALSKKIQSMINVE